MQAYLASPEDAYVQLPTTEHASPPSVLVFGTLIKTSPVMQISVKGYILETFARSVKGKKTSS